MKRVFVLISLVLFSAGFSASYAAFPAIEQTSDVQNVVKQDVHNDFITTANAPVAPDPHLGGSDMGLVFGILALVFGIIAIVAGGVGAIIFGAAAIVLGIIGLNYSWRGLSLAGLILGIVGAVVGLVQVAT